MRYVGETAFGGVTKPKKAMNWGKLDFHKAANQKPSAFKLTALCG